MSGYETPQLLSSEEQEKLIVLKELIPNYLKTKTTKLDEDSLMYNELFDKFYDKTLTELIILNKLYKPK